MNKKFHITAFIGLLVFLLVLTLSACAAQPTATSTFEANVDMPTAVPILLPPLPEAVGYLPAGFVGYVPELGVMLFQEKDGTRIIKLLIQETSKITIPTGLDGSEEVMIHDRSTLIVRGKYDENGKWDIAQKNVQLYWQEDEWSYILSSETVSEVELIKIAWSIE
jgi:hypothetical protein